MIKIDIISGFLGAGKTTLIKKLFESSLKNENVVLIENEFGEIGVDKSFLQSSGIEIKEINAGCICCSLVGDFSQAIEELINKYHPDRIVIEPSGVGKLSDIINAIKETKNNELSLNILATVVDGPKAKMYLKNFGEFFINQVESANTIVISKTENMDEEKLEDLIHHLAHHNENANIISTSINEFTSEKLLSLLETKNSIQKHFEEELLHHSMEHHHCCDEHHHDHDCCHHDHHGHECCHHEHHHEHHCCDEHHHHHHADEVFSTWGKETVQTVSKESLDKFLSTLKDESFGVIIRCKGILKAADQNGWYYFDYVSGDYEIRKGEADSSGRIVVIGSKLDNNKIEELFKRI